MIIYVKLNNYNEEEYSLIVEAHYAWELGKLLSDANFRNQFKYLVAMKEGKILEVYCIVGLAEYPPKEGSNRRRVKFLLEPVSEECFEKMISVINQIRIINPGLLTSRAGKYILEEYLNAYNLPSDCDCGIEHIGDLLDPKDKRFAAQEKLMTKPRKLTKKK